MNKLNNLILQSASDYIPPERMEDWIQCLQSLAGPVQVRRLARKHGLTEAEAVIELRAVIQEITSIVVTQGDTYSMAALFLQKVAQSAFDNGNFTAAILATRVWVEYMNQSQTGVSVGEALNRGRNTLTVIDSEED